MIVLAFLGGWCAISAAASVAWCLVCARRDRHGFVLDGRTSRRVVTGERGGHPHHNLVAPDYHQRSSCDKPGACPLTLPATSPTNQRGTLQ